MKRCNSKLLFFLLVACLSACSHFSKIDRIKPDAGVMTASRRSFLIGKWYGEAVTKDGQNRKSLMHRRKDGTYTVKFQFFKNLQILNEKVEAGYWGVVKDTYFTLHREFLEGENFQSLDVTDPTYYDAYRILVAGDGIFKYSSLETGSEFNVKKVADNFELK